MNMNVTFTWEDVMGVVNMIKGHLIAIGIALAVMILLIVFAGKISKKWKGLIRWNAVLAFCAALVLIVNLILTGPVKELLSATTAEVGTLQEETIANSRAVNEEVASEGFILAKNNGTLPLAAGNLNVFGWASTNPVYGGTGSGSINVATAINPLQGLQNAGFKLNTELSDFYTAYRPERPTISINDGQDWTLPEPPAATYPQAMIDNAKAFSDTAIVMIARCGGEGADLPHDMGAVMNGTYQQGTKYTNALYTNNGDYNDFEEGSTYLELSRTERDLVELVNSNFEHVIILYNGANALEMGWTEDYEHIDAVLLCASPGATGFNAVGKILTGEVNPSGKTVDTWLRDVTKAPYYNNIGHFAYTNVKAITDTQTADNADHIISFVDYVEGIYVGYRYYETAYEEAVTNGYDFDYDSTVMYPFGYGLSYTSFTQTLDSLTEKDGTVTAKVTVTNTGSIAGKDVVELYYTPPYTNGGIEKAAVNLVAFDKTSLLAPGASETLTLTFSYEDMASFDTYGKGCYVLEKGDYTISLRSDAHTVIDESQVITIAADIVYDEKNLHSGDVSVADVKLNFAEGSITYLSRADGFANFAIATAAPSDYELHEDVTVNGTYDPTIYNNASDTMPTLGAKNGLKLINMRGKAYDDPDWEKLLDQLTVADMSTLIGSSGFGTPSVDSVGKISTLDCDGPAGVNCFMARAFGTGFCAEVVMAQTWNRGLVNKLADALCRELNDVGIPGWYAPSMNMHRSAFGGRNFEYYSEDPLISGEMAKAECEAAYSYGVYPYIKHFAMNEQETNRNASLCTWFTEQSAREIYLKPFEACVKARGDHALAVMSSYPLLGTTWDGGCAPLLNGILRGEWGFQGFVLSDYCGDYGYMNADKAIRGGTDAMLGTIGGVCFPSDTTSATSVRAMRTAAHNMFYTIVNSYAYSEENYSTEDPAWMKIMYGADIAAGIIIVGLAVLGILRYRKKAKNA